MPVTRSRVLSSFSFHGLRIGLSSDQNVAEAVWSRLRHFAPTANIAAGTAFTNLTFEVCSIDSRGEHTVERPVGRARPVYQPRIGEIVYFDGADKLYMNYEDRVRVLCDPETGCVRMSAVVSEADHIWLVSRPLFTLCLMELLKRRGRYMLHAAGLSRDGKGLLLAGASGSGKSTLTLALLRAGFGFLGDDMIFLSQDSDGLRALAFPDEIDVTHETVDLFPELRGRLRTPPAPGWPKRRVWVEEVYPVDVVGECRPSALILPRIAHTERSTVHRLSCDEVLLELVSNVLLTDREYSQAHLDILGELVRTTPCYRLETGRDFDALPSRLWELLN